MSYDDAMFIELVDEAIRLTEWAEKLGDPDVGAHGWFFGVTRRTTAGRVTLTLAYEAHRPMAMVELKKVAGRAIEKFGLTRVVIIHRLGEVPVGQASVIVGCSSPHRRETFAALPWMMDVLKRDVPIWKQENYADGTKHWVHPDDD